MVLCGCCGCSVGFVDIVVFGFLLLVWMLVGFVIVGWLVR